MRITRLEIDGFGRLRNLQTDIAPGLHIFFGPNNETGKSHLQQAILGLLYGFYEGDRARKEESEMRERYAPWDAGTYAGRLEYELSNGHRFRVLRDFSTSDQPTTIWDLGSGIDVTDQFGRGRHGNVPFARKHLGMTKRVFESCAFVSQGEVFQISDESKASPQEIGETIVRLADTAGRDVSAQSALARLDKVLKEQVGGPNARTTPLPVDRRRLQDLRVELAGIDRIRSEVLADSEGLERSQSQVEKLRLEAVRNRYLRALANSAEFRARLQQLAGLSTREGELRTRLNEHGSFAHFPVEERDDILEACRRARDLRDSLDAKQDEIEGQRHRLEGLNTERTSLMQRERDLAHLRDFSADRKPHVERLMTAWREAMALDKDAKARLEPVATQAELVREEYERLSSQVGHLLSADLAQLIGRLQAPAPAGSAGALVRAILGGLLRALYWLWRQTVALAHWAWRSVTRQRTIVPTEGPIEAGPDKLFVSPDEARDLLTLHARYREIAPLVLRYREERESAERASEQLSAAARTLHDGIADAVGDASDLERAYDLFIERVEQRRELDDATGRISTNERERLACTHVIDGFETDKERLERQEVRLRQRLEETIGATGDLDSLMQAFEEACRRRSLYDEAKREMGEIEERRGLILEGRSPQELAELGRRHEQECEHLLVQHQWLAGARTSDSREAVQDRLAQQEHALKALEVEIAQLSATIDTKQRDIRPRAEIEEEIARYETEVAALECFRDELNFALDLIREAADEAHRDFGPKVGRFLGDGLAHVTGGRYQRVWLDPASLRVTAEAPETRRPEDVEWLSRGTRAAAYLLLRIGLAQHMSTIAEPVPLVLDDPLVDLDGVRVEQFLELLLNLAAEVQILLFTKDETIRRWFESHCDGTGPHAISVLPGPTAGRAGAP